ncbi:SOS response-associated peptidase [Permianibacter sp. IMCC34836]|uniref:SOS response-associated peptidase n=1 Tax=Permianibacter fluminis TaxID=2738515 RepID=UPI001556A747|nr:SOS response-associated peptidase [Permianibacter fluminis]NQD37487.1 SOS response-associated peptidase [Permianibacter fluminis]
MQRMIELGASNNYNPLANADPERFNVAPSGQLPVLHLDGDGNRRMSNMRWGMTPFWASAEKPSPPMSNARSETVWEKAMFKRSMKDRRCLILVKGFYEWIRDGKTKKPWFIRLKDDEVMMQGGIWQVGHDGQFECCTITTGPNSFMEPIHDRMPVIIPKDSVETWLRSTDQAELNALMLPCPSDWMEGWPVSQFVNNARNEGQHCIDRLPETNELRL